MRKLLVFTASLVVFVVVILVSKKLTEPKPRSDNNQQQLQYTKPVSIEEAISSIDREELKKAVYYLASPELEGRMPGKKGNEMARDYLVEYYRSLGLETTTQEFAVENLNNYKEQGNGKTSNVIATIPGNDQVLKQETIVVGAHFCHVGFGPSMSKAPNRREVHPGADDNASGTAALMGVAKALTKMKGQNKRRIVFISFSAEETGLIGSKYYVNNPKYPNMIFMLNMDMIGRYKTGRLTFYGADNSPQIAKSLVNSLNKNGLKGNLTKNVGGGSDHAPFLSAKIPTIFCHTSLHNEYHTPDDKPDLVDYVGLVSISKVVGDILWKVVNDGCGDYNLKEISNITEFRDHDVKHDQEVFKMRK